jgi:hypothetical protein
VYIQSPHTSCIHHHAAAIALLAMRELSASECGIVGFRAPAGKIVNTIVRPNSGESKRKAAGDGDISIRIVRPRFRYVLSQGGWVFGDQNTHDRSRLAVAGDSKAIWRGSDSSRKGAQRPDISFQVLFYLMMGAHSETASHSEFAFTISSGESVNWL